MMTSPETTAPERISRAAAARAAALARLGTAPEVIFDEGRRERATHVRMGDFDGPLALLLALIEARQLDVLTVPLGGLAEAYLDALATLEGDRLGSVSGFVAVAAQLILIKSRAILPRPPKDVAVPLDEEPDPEAELPFVMEAVGIDLNRGTSAVLDFDALDIPSPTVSPSWTPGRSWSPVPSMSRSRTSTRSRPRSPPCRPSPTRRSPDWTWWLVEDSEAYLRDHVCNRCVDGVPPPVAWPASWPARQRRDERSELVPSR